MSPSTLNALLLASFLLAPKVQVNDPSLLESRIAGLLRATLATRPCIHPDCDGDAADGSCNLLPGGTFQCSKHGPDWDVVQHGRAVTFTRGHFRFTRWWPFAWMALVVETLWGLTSSRGLGCWHFCRVL